MFMELSDSLAQQVARTIILPFLVVDSHLKVQYANEALLRWFKLEPDEIKGVNVIDLPLGFEWTDNLKLMLTNLIEHDTVFKDVEINSEIEESSTYMLLGGRPLIAKEPESDALFLVTLEDYTEQKVLAHELQHRCEDLDFAYHELESFSYSVSHDLRAPLRHMTGFISLLSKKASDKLDPDSLRYVSIIDAASKKMGTLIDDLLTFSRVGRSELKVVEFNFRPMLDDVVEECLEDQESRKIEFRIGDLPSLVGDRSLLRLALVNLVSNAVKYTQKTEQALIEIGCLDPASSDSMKTFFIKDNGIGFDMAYSNKLFGVFQRLHHMDEFEGTGIGLANVNRIIARHGGKIWADSEPGQGATFFFSLPTEMEGSCQI